MLGTVLCTAHTVVSIEKLLLSRPLASPVLEGTSRAARSLGVPSYIRPLTANLGGTLANDAPRSAPRILPVGDVFHERGRQTGSILSCTVANTLHSSGARGIETFHSASRIIRVVLVSDHI